LGCAAGAHYVLGWEVMPSWLAGVAMSTTSVAVVYAVMLEFGFNVTDYGKTVLAACFITDLGTVLALGLIFAPFTMKTVIFVAVQVKEVYLGGGGGRGLGGAPWPHAAFFPPLRQPALGTGGEIPPPLPVGIGSARDRGGQRGGASRLCDRDGAGGNGRQGSRPHSPPAGAELSGAPPPLPHPRRQLRALAPAPLPPP